MQTGVRNFLYRKVNSAGRLPGISLSSGPLVHFVCRTRFSVYPLLHLFRNLFLLMMLLVSNPSFDSFCRTRCSLHLLLHLFRNLFLLMMHCKKCTSISAVQLTRCAIYCIFCEKLLTPFCSTRPVILG